MESKFDPTVEKFSLYEKTSDKGLRLIDIVIARNMVTHSTRVNHRNIPLKELNLVGNTEVLCNAIGVGGGLFLQIVG